MSEQRFRSQPPSVPAPGCEGAANRRRKGRTEGGTLSTVVECRAKGNQPGFDVKMGRSLRTSQ